MTHSGAAAGSKGVEAQLNPQPDMQAVGPQPMEIDEEGGVQEAGQDSANQQRGWVPLVYAPANTERPAVLIRRPLQPAVPPVPVVEWAIGDRVEVRVHPAWLNAAPSTVDDRLKRCRLLNQERLLCLETGLKALGLEPKR